MLRNAKLTVDDEIENALSYYRATFLAQIPELYREIEEALPGLEIAPFFRMGNWIGGDRDGNPFVSAGTLATALARQCETALRHYLTQVHELGAELSISATLLDRVTPALQALADASGDASPHRADEPYRRALIGVYARLAATLHGAHRHRGAAPCGDAEHALPRRGGAARRPAHRRGVAAPPSRRGAGRRRAWRR